MFPKVHGLYLQWGRGAYLHFFRRHDESLYIEKISKLKKLQRYFCSPYLLDESPIPNPQEQNKANYTCVRCEHMHAAPSCIYIE